jgi:hypothetical protein
MKRISLLFLSTLWVAALLPAGRPVMGAVDTDVNPDEAVVFVDGRALGQADFFDGWPEYLYMAPGTYTLEFRLEGYEVFRTAVTVKPWTVTRIERRLVRIPPSAAAEAPPAVEEKGAETASPPPPQPRGTARLALTVSPETAVIYLDGAFLMAGADLARMHSPLQIADGRHTLLCYAPGHEEFQQGFEAGPGELFEIAIVLNKK